MKLENNQKKQEEMYRYPYHYIPYIKNDNFFQVQNLSWGYEYLSYIEFLLDFLSKKEWGNLLDVGCGDGRLTFELKKKFKEKNIKAIDYSDRAIELAKVMSPNVEYFVGDITKKDFFSEKFDIVTLVEVLEHISPELIDDFLKGIKLNLANNGLLLITVPSVNFKVRPKHYQHFDLNSLENVLKPHFKIEKHYYLNAITIGVKLIDKFLTNKFFILNQRMTLRNIYKLYKKRYLLADKNNSKRIFIICKSVQ